jgi:hypothetical protein
MSNPLGDKVVKPVEQPKETWVPHPTNKNVEVNSRTGMFRTKPMG